MRALGLILGLALLAGCRKAPSLPPPADPAKAPSFIFQGFEARASHLGAKVWEAQAAKARVFRRGEEAQAVPQPGRKAQEQYGHSGVRGDIVFFWWQEKDQSVVTQVVDFGQGVVHTTWTSPDRKLTSFRGKVKPLE